jgi:nucleoid-associated protein YgaU
MTDSNGRSHQRGSTATRGSALRAAILTVLAIIAAMVTWRLRPATSASATSPDADIVLGCAWLAWALAGYLAVAIAVTALAHVAAGFGLAAGSLTRIAPASVRRLVDTAVTFSVAATILGTAAAAPAGAATGPPTGARTASIVTSMVVNGSPLDWPGLTEPPAAPIGHHHRPHTEPIVRPAPDPQRSPGRHRPNAGLVNGGAGQSGSSDGSATVVVQAGDTLWTIAARHLEPGASGAAITTAWHAWYAANRAVIGPDPSVIHPGQRLTAPASTQPAGSTP